MSLSKSSAKAIPQISGRDALSDARRAWEAGDATEVLELLGRSPNEPEAALLAARALVRAGEPEPALRLLDRLQQAADRAVRGEASTVAANAHAKLGRLEKARQALQSELGRDLPRRVHAERSFIRALTAWQRKDFQTARDIVDADLRISDGPIYAKGLELLGWIEVSAYKYHSAVRYFLKALDVLESLRTRDQAAQVSNLHILSSIAVETLDLDLERTLVKSREQIAENPGIARRIFFTDQYLAELALLRGDEQEAYNRQVRAMLEAPNDALRLSIEVDTARLFGLHGDSLGVRLHFGRSRQFLESVRWASADVEELMGPLLLAAEAAQSSPELASVALTRALSASGSRDPRLLFEKDRRAMAMALYAQGRVAAQRGSPDAMQLLEEAAQIWDDVGYRYRRAIVALDLYRISQKPSALQPVHNAARLAPGSWLARAVAAINQGEQGLEGLHPAEVRVLKAIMSGLTTQEIARDFGRSPSTISNQTVRIFKVMGVKNRTALVAKVLRLQKGGGG